MQELEHFKTQINLAEYAQSHGYKADLLESSRSSVVMRRGGDKIIVTTAQDGHGIYFSVHDDDDNGSIIDFVQRRQGLNLGQVRKELRPWLTSFSYRPDPHADKPERITKPQPSSADRQQVMAAWMRMQLASRHSYLEQQRGIHAETLADPRFVGMVRIDARGNAVFPHFDRGGVCGYELKNKGFTGFSPGGEKGIWHSTNLSKASRLVLVESAIDAMSHAQLTGTASTGYISTGGSISDKQRDLITGAMAKAHQRGALIVLGTDADEAGRKLAAELISLAPEGAAVMNEVPDCKDWNDQLMAAHKRS